MDPGAVEQSSTILESIADGVIATGTDGRVVFANRAAEELTGWSEGEALGRPIVEVLRLHIEPALLPMRLADTLRTYPGVGRHLTVGHGCPGAIGES